MKFVGTSILMLSCFLLFSDHVVHCTSNFSYDYSATTECLAEPERAQYEGGLIVNPEFTQGIKGWSNPEESSIQGGISESGNRFLVLKNRTNPLVSLSQKILLEKDYFYVVSAWIQLGKGSKNETQVVDVLFRTSEGMLIPGGKVEAKRGCWSFLKGGIVSNISTPVEILLKSNNANVDIWIDSVSLQPFTEQQWRSHQNKSINKVRKSKIRLQLAYANKTAAKDAIVSIHQTRSQFPFGCGMNQYLLNSKGYQDWFVSRFRYTSYTNEMKWYTNEFQQGREDYRFADALVKFCQQNQISIRGHNILWDDPQMQPQWVKTLPNDQLQSAVNHRVNSVVLRYAGQLIGWDVINENLHWKFFDDKLGKNVSEVVFNMVKRLDPNTVLFMNEFNTIEYSRELVASPESYKKRLEEILRFPGNEGLKAGIGVQGHFRSNQPNLAYMRTSLDILGEMGLPIWLTEIDVLGPNQAKYLEDILREGYAHPAVKGMIMFGGPEVSKFDMVLADKDFKNTQAGDVVDKLINEWETSGVEEIKAKNGGVFEVSLFHGDYIATIKNPRTNVSTTVSFSVTEETPHKSVLLQIDDA